MDNLSKIFDVVPVDPPQLPMIKDEAGTRKITDDSEYARANMKLLIDTAKNALENALEVAVQSESPRAYEVLATLINTASDLNTKLIDIHQREQRMTVPDTKQVVATGTTNVTNNAVVFTGTSEDLNKMISMKLKGNTQ